MQLFICLFHLVLFSPFLFQIYVIGNSDKVLPFRGYFFINQTVSPIFEFLYLFNVTAGGFGGSMIAGATSFNLVVIIHGSGKFAVLRRRMEALNGADPNSAAIMGDNVIRHQQAIKLASIKKKKRKKKSNIDHFYIHIYDRRGIFSDITKSFHVEINLFTGSRTLWKGS